MSKVWVPNSKLKLPAKADRTPGWEKDFIADYWLGLGRTDQIAIQNPFDSRTAEDIENPALFVLDLMRRPEYFWFTCKHLLNKTLLPFQLAILRELWVRPFPLLMASRGSGKSFLLAIYSMLRALFCPGSKIVIVGAAFRQSKVVFDYCQEAWDRAPVLRSVVGDDKRNGPRRDVDRCSLRMNDSIILCVPLGDGTKIRGLRATVVVGEEFASIPVDIFETVIRGFAAVSGDPVAKVQAEYRKQAMVELGLWTPEQAANLSDDRLRSNQTIISGTAFYQFNHFYEYFRKYKAIIETKGDPKKLREIFGEHADSVNWRDYSVVRVPVHLVPPEFMDQKQIAHAKATVHKSIYLMEYGACHHPDTEVLTDRGVKRIADVEAGDMVLTHGGRFRPVLHRLEREWDGPVRRWRTHGSTADTLTTPDHPFWAGGDDWTAVDNLGGWTHLANLKELGGRETLDVRDEVEDWMPAGDMIYARPGSSKLDRHQMAEIRGSDLPLTELSRKYGISYNRASTLRCSGERRPPKNAIPAVLPLNFDFGMVVGYYAAEGSTGATGRAAGFALDGHHDTRLEFYVTQLCGALERLLGFAPRVYQKDTVANVSVNARLFVDLIKRICPGVSHTKLIRPDVLFSNPEFLKGFVVGYWNGDGHVSTKQHLCVATCVNQHLLAQVRLALSYFGVSASLYPCRSKPTTQLRGRTFQVKPAFSLVLHGENAVKFKRVFYGREGHHDGSRARLRNDGERTFFRLSPPSAEHYRGKVYDLVVEEDHSYSLLNATVHNCFVSDSDGFFRRSLIEQCVTGRQNNPITKECGPVKFYATLRGDPLKKHVIAVDPASERDNLAITVLEVWPDHRRIVHVWTTTRKRFKAIAKAGLTEESDYYRFAARKIRDLMRAYPCVRLAMDSQGGGVAIMEALQDPGALLPGERPILPVVDPEKPKDTDGLPGEHILELVSFSSAEWVSNANHGLKKDLEEQSLLFPAFDTAIVALAIEDDKASGRVKVDVTGELEKLYDTLEDCVLEIEELKTELTTIQHTQTAGTMRERWDTPDVKMAGTRPGRQKKDRYSSLLMANMAARVLARTPTEPEYKALGGFASQVAAGNPVRPDGPVFIGPEWYVSGLPSSRSYGASVRRGGVIR